MMLFEEKEKSIEKLIKIRTDQKISEYDAQVGLQIVSFKLHSKVGCVFPMFVVTILLQAEFGQINYGKTHPTLFSEWLRSSIWNPMLELFRKRKNFNCKTES